MQATGRRRECRTRGCCLFVVLDGLLSKLLLKTVCASWPFDRHLTSVSRLVLAFVDEQPVQKKDQKKESWPTVFGACCKWEIDEHGSIFKQPCVKNPGCTGERFPSVWMTEVHSIAAAPPVPVW